MRRFASLLGALFVLLSAMRASAQEIGRPDLQESLLDPAVVAALYAASGVERAAEASTFEEAREAAAQWKRERRRARRSRWFTFAGAGTLAGSALGARAFAPRHYCSYDERYANRTMPRAMSGALGAVGLGMSTAGVTQMIRFRELRRKHRSRPGEMVGMIGTMIGTAAASAMIITVSAAVGACSQHWTD